MSYKNAVRMSLLFFIFLTSSAFSAELMWVELESKYQYKDVNSICSNYTLSVPIYLSAEVESGQITVAYFHTSPTWPYANGLKLARSEMAGIELHKDGGGQYWVRRIALSPRLIYFMMRNNDIGVIECLKESLNSAEPLPSFEFDLDGIEEGIKEVLTKTLKFSGKTKTGKLYNASMLINQQQYQLELRD